MSSLLPAFILTLHFEQGPASLTSVITFKPVLVYWAFIGMNPLMVGILLIHLLPEFRAFLGLH